MFQNDSPWYKLTKAVLGGKDMRLEEITNDMTIQALISKYGLETANNILENTTHGLIIEITHLRDKLSDIKMMMSIESNSDVLMHLKYSREEAEISIRKHLKKLDLVHGLIADSAFCKIRS